VSRSISNIAKEALYSQETGEAFLILLTIDHISLETPIRVCNNASNIVSRGLEFIAYPFELTLPDDRENASPRAKLTIDNIDRQIVKTLRDITSTADVLIEIIRAAEPDIVEAKFINFKLSNVKYDYFKVEGDLTIENFTAEPYPAGIFSPSMFPALF